MLFSLSRSMFLVTGFTSVVMGLNLVQLHANIKKNGGNDAHLAVVGAGVDQESAIINANVSIPPAVPQASDSTEVASSADSERVGLPDLTEDAYQKIAALRDDSGMIDFVKLVLEAENKFVPLEEENELAGFVQWFSGTKAVQSLAEMRAELSTKSWVRDVPATDAPAEADVHHAEIADESPRPALVQELSSAGTAEFTEALYQKVASLRDDGAMSDFVKKMLARDNKFVPSEEEKELAGFVQWFSGTKAVQTLAEMRTELLDKSWVKDILATDASARAANVEIIENPSRPNALVQEMSSSSSEFTEALYQQVASLRDDVAMSALVKQMIESEHKFIPPEEENELAGFVQWFSGTKAVQSLAEMRKELSTKNWVRSMPRTEGTPEHADVTPTSANATTEMARTEIADEPPRWSADAHELQSSANAEFTEDGYQKVAALNDDAAMSDFVKRMLERESAFIPQEAEGEFAGFVQWFSGTKATQSLEQLRHELSSKGWVRNVQAILSMAEPTEAQYQEIAALRNDRAMSALVRKILTSENKFIPQEQEDELAGFVQWFSGTKSTQSLAQMRSELFSKSWVKDMPATVAAPKADAIMFAEKPSAVDAKKSPSVADVNSTEESTTSKAPPMMDMHTAFEQNASATCAECFVWGWSRILTFNSFRERMSKHPKRQELLRDRSWREDGMFDSEEGVYWLVQSPSVHIQARYVANDSHPEFTALQAIAISGPVVGGNKLIINTLGGTVTWNDGTILSAMPSDFSNEFVTARYSQQSELVKTGEMGLGVEFSFSNGLFLVVNRWASTLAVRVHMCESHGGAGRQTGQCGTLEHKKIGQALKLTGEAAPALRRNSIIFPDPESR